MEQSQENKKELPLRQILFCLRNNPFKFIITQIINLKNCPLNSIELFKRFQEKYLLFSLLFIQPRGYAFFQLASVYSHLGTTGKALYPEIHT